MIAKPVMVGCLLLPLLLGGCKSIAEKMRSQPAVHFQPKSVGIAGPENDKAQLNLHCMERREVETRKGDPSIVDCAYVSADFSEVVLAGRTNSDETLDALLAISDMNCSNYMHRVFSNRTFMDFSGGLAGDILTGVATATTHVEPNLAAVLGLSNMVVGKGVENFNATYFQEKTFQALEAAINSERERVRLLIMAKRVTADARTETDERPYGPLEALPDIRAYDDACSFKAGLNVLVALAEREHEFRREEGARLATAANQAEVARCQFDAGEEGDKCKEPASQGERE